MTKHELIGKEFKVLSHGSIMLVDYMGSDAEISEAARVSYGKGTRSVNDDINLLRYLKRHHHTTPFEMAEIKFKIKIPMDAHRQFVRHRTANINEYSTRYSEPIDDTDTTQVWRTQSKSNKQGSAAIVGDEWPEGTESLKGLGFTSPSQLLTQMESEVVDTAFGFYDIARKFDVAREQARKNLPLSTYTELFWKCDLHNIMHFLRLRCDSHAQQEIREYANIMAGIALEIFPISMQAWYDYNHKAVSMSRNEMAILKCVVDTYDVDLSSIFEELKEMNEMNLSKREKTEFLSKFKQNYDNHLDEEFKL